MVRQSYCLTAILIIDYSAFLVLFLLRRLIWKETAVFTKRFWLQVCRTIIHLISATIRDISVSRFSITGRCPTIEKITSPKISELVINSFFDAISQGEIKIGETLASERELCDKLGISRGSLREGLSILEFLGVLANQGNRKVLTKDYEIVQKMLEMIKVSTQNDIIQDFIELRREIELLIIRLACQRATAEDIENLRQAIRLLEKDIDTPEADYHFHKSLAEASHNSFLVAVEELLISMVKNIRSSLIDYPGRKKHIIAEHATILQAIINRDQELAQNTMLKHLFFIEKTMSIIDNFRSDVPPQK